jgi:hypothetical protein
MPLEPDSPNNSNSFAPADFIIMVESTKADVQPAMT